MQLDELDTPCLVIDEARMQHNIARMQRHMDALGVSFRPHVKTSKCLDVVRQQRDAGARGITVSTLKEAEEFFDGGFDDIFYAVAMAPNKVQRALALKHAVASCASWSIRSRAPRPCLPRGRRRGFGLEC